MPSAAMELWRTAKNAIVAGRRTAKSLAVGRKGPRLRKTRSHAHSGHRRRVVRRRYASVILADGGEKDFVDDLWPEFVNCSPCHFFNCISSVR